MTPSDRIKEIRERLAQLPELPYDNFPVQVIERDYEGELTGAAKTINTFTQFGLEARADLAFLLAETERLTAQLKVVCEGLERIESHSPNSADKVVLLLNVEGYRECARKALAEIAALNGGEK